MAHLVTRDNKLIVKESLKKTMVAIFIRSHASTDHEIFSTEFLRPVFENFGQKPILIIHHHSDPDSNFQNDTSQLKSSYARDSGIVHCKDDGEILPNGNSIFIHNFCRAFNSYDDFSGQVLIFMDYGLFDRRKTQNLVLKVRLVFQS